MKIKLVKQIMSYMLSIAIITSMLTGFSVAWAAETVKGNSDNKIYVALGDSVPAGYGLANSDDCYVKLFSDKMKENGCSNTMYNYAVSGITTGGLLTGLQNLQSSDPESFKVIKSAKVITLNIGGNNVLGTLIKTVNEGISQQLKTLGLTSIAQATSLQLKLIGLSLATMTLEDTQLKQFRLGAKSFSEDFPEIIAWLKLNAPNSDIIVSTIYNPIPSGMSFYKTSVELLSEMNKVIADDAEKSGYYVSDVATAYAEAPQETQLLNLNLGQYSTSPLSVDIHPNVEGHKLIAKVYHDTFQKIPSIVDTKTNTPVTASVKLPGVVDKNGILTLDITKQILQTVIKKAQSEAKLLARDKDGIAIVFENNDSDFKSMNVKFASAAIDLLKSEGVKQISVNTNVISFGLDQAAIKEIESKTKSKVTFKVIPVTKLSKTAKKLIANHPVYKASIADASGNPISDLGKGKITFSFYYQVSAKEKTEGLYVVSINSKGKPKKLTGSVYKEDWVTFASNSISSYGIAYKK